MRTVNRNEFPQTIGQHIVIEIISEDEKHNFLRSNTSFNLIGGGTVNSLSLSAYKYYDSHDQVFIL
jgi:hypothetical protein